MPQLQGRNVSSATYDEETEDLTVTFQSGPSYEYSAVPLWVYNGLIETIDPDGYFYQVIRSGFSYEIVG